MHRVARKSDGKGGSTQRVIGIADDYQEADGSTVLTWGQAQANVFAIVAMNPRSRLTIREVIDGYAVDLAIRGGDPGNVARLRHCVSLPLMDRMVDDLRGGELREWRDGLLKDGLRPATVNRTCNALRAALNRAADQRKEVVNRHVWQRDLVALPDASFARNVILSDHVVRSLVASAYAVGEGLGLLVETTAVTGARYSQLGRLQVKDLQDDLTSPRLMMPSSRKGKAVRRVVHRPVPIPVSLATRLRTAARGRHGTEPLLVRAGGESWKKSDHTRLFARAVRMASFDGNAIAPYSPSDITIYSLRHSSIARQILRGVPIRVVAVMHDTSVAMIEKNYSALLADHSDAITRAALIELA